ncbi:MAG: lysophospholipid acyltransferase family protein [Thermomicrobiales bacterium]
MSATPEKTENPSPTHRDDRDRIDHFHRTRLYHGIYHGTRWFVRAAFVPLLHLDVHGQENVPRRGPLIVACNHLHNFDPAVVGAVLPRNLFFMAKKELFAVPVLRHIVRLYGGFEVDRGSADRAALRYAVHVVEDGEALFMFPEGTRSLTGRIEKVLPGAAFVALRTGAPILPVAVTGTQTLPFDEKAAKAGRKRRGRVPVTVTFGRPFHLTPGPDGKRPDMQTATDEMMRHVAALLPPEYRGIYADVGEGGG